MAVLSVFHKNQIFKTDGKELNAEIISKNKHLRIYNLKKPNNGNFECVKSAKIIVETTICIHDIQRDVYVSRAIKYNGVWESHMVTMFMQMLDSNKDVNVLGK